VGIGSANSVTLEAVNSSATATVSADRPTATDASTNAYTTTSSLVTGPVTLHVRLWSGTGGSGFLVGRADVSAVLKADGSLTKTDGTALGDLQMETTVKSVQVERSKQIPVGSSSQVVATAYDAIGNVLAIEPGAFTYSVKSGGAYLSIDASGVATGLSAGNAMVEAVVDGVSSGDTLVMVTAASGG